MKVGIIGYGWVGKAMHKLFHDAEIYDKFLSTYNKPMSKRDIVFVCVPTPLSDTMQLDCSIVEEAIQNANSDLVVVRSTTNPGFCDSMAKKYPTKRIVMQPEYLGETANHPYIETENRNFMILGGDSADRRKVIECYHSVYNAKINIRQVTRIEAEIIKLTENRAAFYKIIQCQELYDVCEVAGVDYYTIRDGVYGDDQRFTLFWTFVYPSNRGANSKCIPKDVYAWCAWAESVGIKSEVTEKLLEYNKKLVDNN